MTDPIAEAAKQNESSLLEKATETIHTLEEKVEKLVHPEAASEPQSAAGESSNAVSADAAPPISSPSADTNSAASAGEQGNVLAGATDSSPLTSSEPSAPILPSASTENSGSGADLPNAVTAAVAQPDTQPSAAVVSTLSGTVGIVASSADRIRSHLAAIKHHLSIRGFEQSAIADIHAELDAIEGWL